MLCGNTGWHYVFVGCFGLIYPFLIGSLVKFVSKQTLIQCRETCYDALQQQCMYLTDTFIAILIAWHNNSRCCFAIQTTVLS